MKRRSRIEQEHKKGVNCKWKMAEENKEKY